jgi:hypothetical protein
MKALLRGLRVKGTEWFHIHHHDVKAILVQLQKEHP